MNSTLSTSARERSGVLATQPALRIMVNDQEVVVDPRTLTLLERKLMRIELSKMGIEPDEIDYMAVTIWVVMRRTDPALSFDDVLAALDIESLDQAEQITDQENQDPEALGRA